jgi:hypothetical protein
MAQNTGQNQTHINFTGVATMNLFKKLFGGAPKTGAAGEEDNALIYYVKGKKCGAVTRVRIDKRNDLSRDDEDLLFVRKVVVDSKCYGQVEIEMRFDESFNEVSRAIIGGEFVGREEWEAQNVEKPA